MEYRKERAVSSKNIGYSILGYSKKIQKLCVLCFEKLS